MGGIASISADSKSFDQYVIIRNAKNGSWGLSKPISVWPSLDDAHHIVHLAWNFIGTELAVVDSSGRISIYQNTGVSLGEMAASRQGTNDPDTDMHSIVGLHWLSVMGYTQKVSNYYNPNEAFVHNSRLVYFGRRAAPEMSGSTICQLFHPRFMARITQWKIDLLCCV
jgi:hypothetical protein